MTTLTARDAAALLDIAHEGVAASGTEPFPPSVLRSLARLIPSDACVGYQEADVTGRFRVVEQVEIIGEPSTAAVEEAFRALGHQNPLRCRLRAQERRALRLSDFMTATERRRLDYYAEVWRPHGIEDALRLWLPAPPGRARSVYLERGGRNYTKRDKTLFELLRPHFIRIRGARETRRHANRLSQLTEREAEVLGWVADGRTNHQIASTLSISPHTVRKHLENIFEKLGVHTRTAAVAHVADAARPAVAAEHTTRRAAAAEGEPHVCRPQAAAN